MNDFKKYATKHLGMNSLVLDDVIKSQAGYLNPYILEERQLNVTQLDVFSRLMMDRIIFLGMNSRGPTARPESSNTGVHYLGPSWLKLASWIPGTRYLLLEVETVKDEYPIGSSLSLAPVFPIPAQQLMVRVNFYVMITMCQKPHLSNFQVSLI